MTETTVETNQQLIDEEQLQEEGYLDFEYDVNFEDEPKVSINKVAIITTTAGTIIGNIINETTKLITVEAPAQITLLRLPKQPEVKTSEGVVITPEQDARMKILFRPSIEPSLITNTTEVIYKQHLIKEPQQASEIMTLYYKWYYQTAKGFSNNEEKPKKKTRVKKEE